jgi:hypothetical protein
MRPTMQHDLASRLEAAGLAADFTMDLHPHVDDGDISWLKADGPIIWLDEFHVTCPGSGRARGR